MPDDRVSVGRHVVETRPRPCDRHARCRREPARDPLDPVGDERLVDRLLVPPARRGLRHREHERVAAAAEVEAGLRLDRQREIAGEPGDGRGLDELADERPDRQLDSELRRERCGRRAGREHEDVRVELERVGLLSHLDTELRGAPHELASDARRVGRPVLPAEHGAEHVVRHEALDPRGVDALDRDAERRLYLAPPLELVQPVLGRREEEISDRLEELRAERAEEPHALAGQAHFRCRRELLPDAPERLAGRSRRDGVRVREHDPVRAAEREVVRDGGADDARAGYDEPAASHASSSATSAASRSRSGGSHVGADRDALPGGHALERGVPRKRLHRRAERRQRRCPFLGRIADDRRHLLGERGRERGDGADRTRLATAVDERLRADEDVEPVKQVALERLPWSVRDLHPDDVVRLLPKSRQHRRVERVPGRRGELVDVERERRAGCSRREEVRTLCRRVQLEVRRPDHCHGVRARLRRVGRQRDGVLRALRSAVRSHQDPPGDRFEPALEPAAALVGRQEHRLAVRPERQHPVEPGAHEEVGVRPERVVVEPCSAVRERRRGRGDRPSKARHRRCACPERRARPWRRCAARASRAAWRRRPTRRTPACG